VSFANKLQKEETEIDFNKPATVVHNLIRGIYKSPSAFFKYDGKIIKVLESEVSTGQGIPGKFINISKLGIDIACGKDCIKIIKVKPEGKGEMLARDWYNGLINKGK